MKFVMCCTTFVPHDNKFMLVCTISCNDLPFFRCYGNIFNTKKLKTIIYAWKFHDQLQLWKIEITLIFLHTALLFFFL